MCGIFGVFTTGPAAGRPELVRAVEAMAERMARRGPDDAGAWANPDGRLALGFHRLAVLDPSPAGHQPMVSGDGRSVLAFNGKIYNSRALRRLTSLRCRSRPRCGEGP